MSNVATVLSAHKIPKGMYTANQVLDMKFPPMRWLREPIIPAKGTVILGGKQKLGKSYFVLGIMAEVCNEDSLVCYFSLEDDLESLSERLVNLKIKSDNLILQAGYSDPLNPLESFKIVNQLAIDNPTLKLVVLDTMVKALPRHKRTENDYQDWVDKLSPWNELATEHDMCILMTHHHSKLNSGTLDDFLGSTGITASFGTILSMVKGTGDSDQITLKATGKRVRDESYRLAKKGYGYEILDIEAVASITEKDGDKAKILYYVQNNIGCKYAQMEKDLKLSNLWRDSEKLIDDGLIERVDREYHPLVP